LVVWHSLIDKHTVCRLCCLIEGYKSIQKRQANGIQEQDIRSGELVSEFPVTFSLDSFTGTEHKLRTLLSEYCF